MTNRKFDIYDAIQQTANIQECEWAEACKMVYEFITENPSYCLQIDCFTRRTTKDVMVNT